MNDEAADELCCWRGCAVAAVGVAAAPCEVGALRERANCVCIKLRCCVRTREYV